MTKKRIIYTLSGAGILIIVLLVQIYRTIFGISIHAEMPGKIIIIPTGSSYEQVLDSLLTNHIIEDRKVFDWVAKKKNYPALIKPGRYLIDKDFSYNSFINMLRSGHQTPVRITFQNIRTLNQLAGKIGRQIEADSAQIMSFLSDDSNYNADGFTKGDSYMLFSFQIHMRFTGILMPGVCITGCLRSTEDSGMKNGWQGHRRRDLIRLRLPFWLP